MNLMKERIEGQGRREGNRLMFNAKVTYGSGGSFSILTPIVADRLPEAEQYVTAMLSRVFPDVEVVMVHVGDLKYKVYPVDEPIAVVQIETGECHV